MRNLHARDSCRYDSWCGTMSFDCASLNFVPSLLKDLLVVGIGLPLLVGWLIGQATSLLYNSDNEDTREFLEQLQSQDLAIGGLSTFVSLVISLRLSTSIQKNYDILLNYELLCGAVEDIAITYNLLKINNPKMACLISGLPCKILEELRGSSKSQQTESCRERQVLCDINEIIRIGAGCDNNNVKWLSFFQTVAVFRTVEGNLFTAAHYIPPRGLELLLWLTALCYAQILSLYIGDNNMGTVYMPMILMVSLMGAYAIAYFNENPFYWHGKWPCFSGQKRIRKADDDARTAGKRVLTILNVPSSSPSRPMGARPTNSILSPSMATRAATYTPLLKL